MKMKLYSCSHKSVQRNAYMDGCYMEVGGQLWGQSKNKNWGRAGQGRDREKVEVLQSGEVPDILNYI